MPSRHAPCGGAKAMDPSSSSSFLTSLQQSSIRWHTQDHHTELKSLSFSTISTTLLIILSLWYSFTLLRDFKRYQRLRSTSPSLSSTETYTTTQILTARLGHTFPTKLWIVSRLAALLSASHSAYLIVKKDSPLNFHTWDVIIPFVFYVISTNILLYTETPRADLCELCMSIRLAVLYRRQWTWIGAILIGIFGGGLVEDAPLVKYGYMFLEESDVMRVIPVSVLVCLLFGMGVFKLALPSVVERVVRKHVENGGVVECGCFAGHVCEGSGAGRVVEGEVEILIGDVVEDEKVEAFSDEKVVSHA